MGLNLLKIYRRCSLTTKCHVLQVLCRHCCEKTRLLHGNNKGVDYPANPCWFGICSLECIITYSRILFNPGSQAHTGQFLLYITSGLNQRNLVMMINQQKHKNYFFFIIV